MSLYRRGIHLGRIPVLAEAKDLSEKARETEGSLCAEGSTLNSTITKEGYAELQLAWQIAWKEGAAIKLSNECDSLLASHHTNIVASKNLYQQVLLGEQSCDELLDQEPYLTALKPQFESLGSSINEGDDQEIETVLFDAISNQNVVAEDLWMKASWLSFHEEDASLRFRFSFGVDLHEDVAADELRQDYAAELADAVFPESLVITANQELRDSLNKILSTEHIKYVERIVYFNSPNGGAYLHHDRERGHAGVVFAQLSGQTFWLALSKQNLLEQLVLFFDQCVSSGSWPLGMSDTQQAEFTNLVTDLEYCAEQLESFSNETLIYVINETQEFVQQLIRNGYSHHLHAGDVLLLPQETELNCCWHSVFCVGDEVGQALSFAIRTND